MHAYVFLSTQYLPFAPFPSTDTTRMLTPARSRTESFFSDMQPSHLESLLRRPVASLRAYGSYWPIGIDRPKRMTEEDASLLTTASPLAISPCSEAGFSFIAEGFHQPPFPTLLVCFIVSCRIFGVDRRRCLAIDNCIPLGHFPM